MAIIHISTLDGMIQALQELKSRLPGDTPVVMRGLWDDAVSVTASAARMTKGSATQARRVSANGKTPCVLIGRSR